MGLTFNQKFARETWSLYGIGMIIMVLRFMARIKKLGITKLQADDYMMFNAMFWYTLLVVSINTIIAGGGSNYMTPDQQASLTPETIREREKGSKWVFVSEQAMILCIWSLKLCMLFIYARLTDGLKQRKLVNALFIWVGLGFVGTQLCLFLACRPFNQYWAVHPSNAQCATYQHYEITESIFNTSADICMLLIGLPLLLSVRVPIQQKFVLLFVFGMGIFVIIAAILTKIYCLVPDLISYVYLNWYFREASVSVYVTNLPALWSLARDTFPGLKRWGFGGSAKKSTTVSGTSRKKAWNLSSTARSSKYGGAPTERNFDFDMHKFDRLEDDSLGDKPKFQSTDYINPAAEDGRRSTTPGGGLTIKQDISFMVENKSSLESSDLESGGEMTRGRGETICSITHVS